MKAKRILALLLVFVLAVAALAGCKKEESSSKGEKKEEKKTESEVQEFDGSLTSVEFAHRMGNGINLGNTMEAYGHTSIGVEGEVSAYETLWGCPITTQEMLTAMKAAGFDTLRLPVAWTNMMDYESGDYTINKAYLDRVEEIANYALNEDMYVIINDHWDGGWWGMFGSATPETREKAMTMYKEMWTQVGERFANYDEHIIFESANEELGNRLNDVDVATDSGSLDLDACYTTTNGINQAFVDTIRSLGGNNDQRYLLIAGFDTNINNTCDDRFQMPKDSAESKLLLSVHYYDPSGYCINTSLATWGNKDDYNEQNEMLAKMTKFTEQGYGIVIGEYGVLAENKEVKANTVEYTTNFLHNCDIYGYCPVLWDTNNLFNREEGKFIDDAVAQLYLDFSYEAQSATPQETIIADAKKALEDAVANAEEGVGAADDEAVAWIMYNSSDWSMMYSVGDVYDPMSKTEGIVATDAQVTGEGTYTVGLDFTGTEAGFANSVIFSAVAIANGETLFPGYIINIKEILVNGEPYAIKGKPYTASDDGICTRVNLYNSWVTEVPDDIRIQGGNATGATPVILDAATLGNVETIEVTFDYVAAE